MRRSLAIWAALLIGGSPACLLRLDNEIACGDGFVDQRAGEQCEPSIPSSYENECPGLGTADCDPVTCQLINDRTQCAVCGDGMVDEGEECDGDTFNGNACPGGNGALQCTSDCMLDLSQFPAVFAGVAYGYITYDTLEYLGEPRDYNQMLFVVAENADLLFFGVDDFGT